MANNIKETIFADCPIRNVLARICDKWSLLIIHTLSGEERLRFSELRKRIPDISQKMLTSSLRTLEADGYVSREVFAEVPPRVEYALTERAHTLLPIVYSLTDWAQNNMAAILNDRRSYASCDAPN